MSIASAFRPFGFMHLFVLGQRRIITLRNENNDLNDGIVLVFLRNKKQFMKQYSLRASMPRIHMTGFISQHLLMLKGHIKNKTN